MIKVIRPKSIVNIGTNKLGTNTVCNSSIGAFHRAKLLTAIRSSRTDSKAMTIKKAFILLQNHTFLHLDRGTYIEFCLE